MTEGMEVYTMTDKDQRDRTFEDLRKNGNELEKQVVRFSGNELVTEAVFQTPEWALRSPKTGMQRKLKMVKLPVYRSTWSLAYPKSRGAAL